MTTPNRQHPQQRVAGATWLAPACAAVLALVSLPVGAAIVDLTKEAAETMRVMPSSRPVASVVGNTGYEHIAPDPSGKNDAEAVAGLLGGLGFEVVGGVDLDRAEFVDRVADFHDRSPGTHGGTLLLLGLRAPRGTRGQCRPTWAPMREAHR